MLQIKKKINDCSVGCQNVTYISHLKSICITLTRFRILFYYQFLLNIYFIFIKYLNFFYSSTNQKSLISDGLESKKISDKEESENSSSNKVPVVQKVELQIHSPPVQSADSEPSTKTHDTQSSVGKLIMHLLHLICFSQFF